MVSLWGAVLVKHNSLLIAMLLIQAVILAVVAATLPWGIFFLTRWIARGFASE